MGLQSYQIRWNNEKYATSLRCLRSRMSVPIESSYATSYEWLILTGILSRTVSSQIIVQILDEKWSLCVFQQAIEATYTLFVTVHLIAHWKARSELPIRVNWIR